MTAYWTDSHCHLTDERLGVGAIERARDVGVGRLVTVGCDVADSAAALGLALLHEDVWATAGVHPHEASRGTEGLVDLLDHPGLVAVGECGLDYHYDNSPRPAQREVFAEQVALARERDLPLVIHTREAWADTFDLLGSVGVPRRLVFHCFTGGPDEARRALDMGAHLSFSGIVTFPSAEEVRSAALICPLERTLVETDSPYLAPVPHRGRVNEPSLLPAVGAVLAELHGRALEEVAGATSAAAGAVFGLGGRSHDS